MKQEVGHCKPSYNKYPENIVSLNDNVAGRHSFALKRLKATNGGTTKDDNFDHRYSFYNIETSFPIIKHQNLFFFTITIINYIYVF